MAQGARAALVCSTAVVLVFASGYAKALRAQTFPDKPLRLLVGQATGTSTDLVARIVASRWGDMLGQPVVVDNRPGAAEAIAADAVAKAAPDGYTILFGSIASHGIGPALRRSLPYDPVRDFAALSMVGTVPNVLVVNPGIPVRGISEFLAYVRANPARLNYASTGVGTSTHLSMELLKSRTAIDIVHVPYKSGSAAFIDVMGGQVSAALFNLPSQLPLIKAGKVRALAVSSVKRSAQLPDVPTIAESGVPGYEVVVWYAIFAPAATPRDIHGRLYERLIMALESPDLRERMTGQLGVDPVTSTPDELVQYTQREIEKWAKVAKEAGVTIE